MSGKRAHEKKTPPSLVFLILLVVFTLVAGGIWGYTQRVGPFALLREGKAGNDKTLTIATAQPVTSLDLTTNTSDGVTQALLGNVYETLVGRDLRNNPTPTGVAKNWTISSDKLTYTFTLKSDLKFSNGHALDSEDVVHSLQQTIQNQTAGYGKLSNIASASGKDMQVVLSLSRPDPTLLWSLSTAAGVVYDSEAKYDKVTQAVGSGPYTVKKFTAGKSIELEANPSYKRNSKSYASTVVLKAYTDPVIAAKDLTSGRVDAIIPMNNAARSSHTPTEAGEILKEQKDITVSATSSLHRWGIALNTSADSLFSDKRIRQSYNILVDRATLIHSLGISAVASTSPVSSLDPGYKKYDADIYDLAKSQRLISYFGYARNFKLSYISGHGGKAADLLSNQLVKTGGTVTAQALTDAQWKSHIVKAKKFDMALVDYADSHDTRSLVDVNYFTQYTNAEADTAREAIDTAATDEQYASAVSQAADVLAKNTPVIWLYEEKPLIAYRSDISGIPSALVDSYLPLTQIEKK